MELRLLIIYTCTFFPLISIGYQPKEGNIFAALGPSLMKTLSENSTNQPVSGYRGDGALFVQGDINSHGSLEITIFHFNKSYFRESNGEFAAEEIEQMHIGMGYRHWLSPKFSLGLSFASSYAMSEAKVIHKDPENNLLDTSARDVSEFCFDFSAQYLIWERDQEGVLIDLRYSRDITARVGEHGDHLVGAIAYRRFIQGK